MMHNYYGPHAGGYGYRGGGLLEIVFTILFWSAIFTIVIFLIKGLKNSGKYRDFEQRNDSALDILKQRYAKGELNKKEFDQMKKDIE
jgi:putative membrane protein